MMTVRDVVAQRLRGRGIRPIAASTGLDRKTVQRYVDKMADLQASEPGWLELPHEDLVTALVPRLMAAVRPGGSRGSDEMESLWLRVGEIVKQWHKDGVPCPKMRRLLRERYQEDIALRTLQRQVQQRLGSADRAAPTQWVADCKPGEELQVDFCELGVTVDLETGKNRKLHALVMVAVRTRHMFVWPTWRCTTEELLAGLEAAFLYFGGAFGVVVIDNTKAAVRHASQVAAELHPALIEHKLRWNYDVCTSRVRRPQDKARVERNNAYVQTDMYGGEQSKTLAAWRAYAQRWCLEIAGMRTHGETRRKPLEHFTAEELGALLPTPSTPWMLARWSEHKVSRDGRVRIRSEMYVVTGRCGQLVLVRQDATTVEIFHQGTSVLKCARVGEGGTGGDLDSLKDAAFAASQRNPAPMLEEAARHGASVLAVSRHLLAEQPWFRQVNRFRHLMKLCAIHGDAACEQACKLALSLDVYDVTRISRCLERDVAATAAQATEAPTPAPPPAATLPTALPRFARPVQEFVRRLIAA